MRNARLRWNELENGTDKNSECAKHLNENDNHEFKGSIFSLAPKVLFKTKILEVYFIKTLNPILNNQLNSDKWCHLFQFPNVCLNNNFLIVFKFVYLIEILTFYSIFNLTM